MTANQLARRSLAYYWRTNVAVVLGVATAVAVLAGALLVGDSVRGSLRDLVMQRLGRTDLIVASSGFFRDGLANDVRANDSFASSFGDVAPLIVVQGLVGSQESGRRVGQVRVYGVDDRFWRFHAVPDIVGPLGRDAYVSTALASELGAEPGSTLLLRIQRPSDVPLESLHGRKDDLVQTVRLTLQSTIARSSLGEFSLDLQQGDVRALFVPLATLQEELGIAGRANVLLVAATNRQDPQAPATLEKILREEATLGDVGLTLKILEGPRAIAIGSASGLLNGAQAASVRQAVTDAGAFRMQPVFTYLSNSLRSGDREVPYSLVSATDLNAAGLGSVSASESAVPPIVLNEWAARELQAGVGTPVTMEYYVWEEPGRLVTRSTGFRVAAVVPVAAGDPDLAPEYPGISESPTLADWDPPFPIDLRRIRPADEAYWSDYRTTPKAFVPLEVGQGLWRSRYGALTSIRATPADGEGAGDARDAIERHLRARIDPLAAGLVVRHVRDEGLAASRGATNFGEYFVYFSFFLVVSALLLVGLFFRLGVEQRAREVGLLRAVGMNPSMLRRLFLREGLVLALAGSLAGVFGALAYSWLIMSALATWWVDAVGTTALAPHVTLASLISGAGAGVVAALACVWWTLRGLARMSERSLLAGVPAGDATGGRRRVARFFLAALGSCAAAAMLLAAAASGLVNQAGAFFAAGAALLAAALFASAALLRLPAATPVAGHGWWPVFRLGFRNTTHRPGRSVLSVAVIAAATFILIAVDAFRHDASISSTDRRSGVGGYQLIVESLVPIVYDPNSREGRQALNLSSLDESVSLEPFRLLPGDDASCLNLYEPKNPRVLAPRDSFLAEGRFAFQSSLAESDAERANPWLLLRRTYGSRQAAGAPGPPGENAAIPVIPVIVDANSMTYVLHKKLGDEIVVPRGTGEIRLRIVAALRDSIFQRDVLMSEANFLRLFPGQEGFQVLLAETPGERSSEIGLTIEEALADFGADVTGTADRLAAFHRVENTYLSTFQTLGALGLLLGTVGLATVLLRNVLERRRELALLGAVGYRGSHFLMMVVAENAVLLMGGLAAGTVCAAIAIAPAIAERGGRIPLTSGGALMIFAVLTTGLLSSIAATRGAVRGRLLDALRSE